MNRRMEMAVLGALAVALLALLLAWRAWEASDPLAPPGEGPPPVEHEPDRPDRAPPPEGEEPARVALASEAQEPAAGDPAPARVTRPLSLRVTLVDEAGRRIEERAASVTAVNAAGRSWRGYRAEPGRYQLRELEPGRWWVRGACPGRSPAARELHLPRTDAALELELALAPSPAVRIVLLTPDGAAFENARPSALRRPRVVATRARPGARLAEPDEEAACGSFVARDRTELDLRHLGRLLLDCEPPLWVSLVVGEHVLDAQQLLPGVDELTFVLDVDELAGCYGELRLRVVDAESGAPLSWASGWLHQGADGSRMTHQGDRGDRVFVVGGAGPVLRFRDVRPGTWRIDLSADEYEHRSLEVVCPRGERVDLGDVPLEREPKALLAVRVHGGEGARVLGLDWRRLDGGEPAPRLNQPGDARSPALAPGVEAVLPLAPGRYLVWAKSSHDGGRRPLRSRACTVELEPGRTELELEVEEAALMVLLPGHRTLRVTLAGPDPTLPWRRAYELRGVPKRMLLLPGEYELTLRDGDGGERVQRVTLPPEGATLQLD